MQTLLHDLRFAVRMIRRSPGLTLAAVLSLALGIGANTTVFSWVQAALLRPLPGVPRQSDVVVFTNVMRPGPRISLSYPDYVDYRDRGANVAALAAFSDVAMSLTVGDRAERVYGAIVSANYFDVLDVRPADGRAFGADEDRAPGGSPVVVLGYHFWQRRLAADPSVVGRTLTLNGHPFTVIGITPAGFTGTTPGLRTDLWVPMMMQQQVAGAGDRLHERGNHWLQAIARLAPGVTRAQAESAFDNIAAGMAQQGGQTARSMRIALYPLWRAPNGAPAIMLPVLSVLGAVVGLVLLIACANVANLLLGRAVGRRREVAIRMSLGASRGRLLRQLMTESILLALMGGAAGVLVAAWGAGLLMRFVPASDTPYFLAIGIDGQVLGFTLTASIVTGLLFGLAPALQTARGDDVVSTLKDESATSAGSATRSWLRNGLVVAQVALSAVLLVGAGLFLRALQAAQHVDPGFRTDGVLLAGMDLFPNGYTPDQGRTFVDQLLVRVRALPGVSAASTARRIPLGIGGGNSSSRAEIDGYQPRPDEAMIIEFNSVSSDYFRTMRIPLVRGREFTQRDGPDALRVAIVNQTMAERFFGAVDPVGRRIRIAGGDWRTIVGVVPDIKYHRLNEPPMPFVYLPFAQAYNPQVALHVQAAGDAAALLPAVRSVVRELDPNLPIYDAGTLAEHMKTAVFTERIAGTLLGLFGALALVLAAVGLYGVVSYAVSRRVHEMGVRMALGASPAQVRSMVLRQGAGLTVAGLGLGIGLALAATRLVGSLLHGVSPWDPLTFASVSILLGGVAVVASVVPATRASRVDPVVALRYE